MSDILSNTFYSHRTGSKAGNATTARVSKTFEVIDYDSLEGCYAVAYKSIAISHTQTWQRTEIAPAFTSSALYCQPGWNLISLCPLTYTVTDVQTSIASRIITYKLYYKIKNYKVPGTFITNSIDLAICTINAVDGVQTVSGQRVYGMSIQISEEFICYSYELGDVAITTPINLGNTMIYDGPVKLEDWNYDKSIPAQPIWLRNKHVVGLINIKDGKNSTVGYTASKTINLTEELKETFTPEQYATGVRIDLNTVEVIQ
jgi:hypothetical protein